MKRTLTITALFLFCLGASAQVNTNSPPPLTYTNGVTVRLPINDRDFSLLAYYRRMTGQTNVPLSQFVTNNLTLTLNPRVDYTLQLRRTAIMRKLATATDGQLSAVEADLAH